MSAILEYNFSCQDYASLSPYTNYSPKEEGTFAIDDSGHFGRCNKATHASLKHITIPLDLNEGYDRNRKFHNETVTNFPAWEKLLKWIFSTDGGYEVTSDIDVITQRGILKDIGYTLQNRYRNKWTLEVCKFDGKLYLRYFDDDVFHVTPQHHMNLHRGRRFEYNVLEKQEGVKATYNVIKSSIGNTRLLISAEVDGQSVGGEHVEVKTCFERNLNNQLPLHWLQSYLGTIKIMYYGIKDSDGVLRQPLRREEISKIPGEVVLKGVANSMFGLIADILHWLKEVVEEGDHLWSLQYNGKPEGNGGKITLYDTETSFLPPWYREFVDTSRRVNQESLDNNLVNQISNLTLEQSGSETHDVTSNTTSSSTTPVNPQQCLFLTDSVLSSTPVTIFEHTHNFKGVKKVKKYLLDLFQFENMFGNCNTVIISGGINDLSSGKKAANQLMKISCPWLTKSCSNYKETLFIFNSVLQSYYTRLNTEIDQFNKLMFDLSKTIPNLLFFDSHSVLQDDPITHHPFLQGVFIESNPCATVHIQTKPAALISQHLAYAVEFAHCHYTHLPIPYYLNNWTWPLRRNFAD